MLPPGKNAGGQNLSLLPFRSAEAGAASELVLPIAKLSFYVAFCHMPGTVRGIIMQAVRTPMKLAGAAARQLLRGILQDFLAETVWVKSVKQACGAQYAKTTKTRSGYFVVPTDPPRGFYLD
jgi:hypothetical protein